MKPFVLGLAGLSGAAVAWLGAFGAGVPGSVAGAPSASPGPGTTVPAVGSAAAVVSTGATPQAPSGLSGHEIARAERFLENRAACLGCHRIAGRGGQIGPSLAGLAERADAEYVRSIIRNPQSVVPGSIMPRQTMPEDEIARLAAYLLSPAVSGAEPEAPAATPQAPPALAEGDEENGAALYARHCAACHGTEGHGDGWNAANLPVAPTSHADPALMGARPDDSLYDAIHSGAYVLDGSPRMPPFGALLTDAQIRALVARIRTLCDCTEPTWANSR